MGCFIGVQREQTAKLNGCELDLCVTVRTECLRESQTIYALKRHKPLNNKVIRTLDLEQIVFSRLRSMSL